MKKIILLILCFTIWKALFSINPSDKVSIKLFINKDTTVLVATVQNNSLKPIWFKDFYYFYGNIVLEKDLFLFRKDYKKKLEKLGFDNFPDKEYPDISKYSTQPGRTFFDDMPMEKIDSIVNEIFKEVKNKYPNYKELYKRSMTDEYLNILKSIIIEEAIKDHIRGYLIGAALFLESGEKFTYTYIIHPIKEKRGKYSIFLNYEYIEESELYGYKWLPFELKPITKVGDYILIDKNIKSNIVYLEIK